MNPSDRSGKRFANSRSTSSISAIHEESKGLPDSPALLVEPEDVHVLALVDPDDPAFSDAPTLPVDPNPLPTAYDEPAVVAPTQPGAQPLRLLLVVAVLFPLLGRRLLLFCPPWSAGRSADHPGGISLSGGALSKRRRMNR